MIQINQFDLSTLLALLRRKAKRIVLISLAAAIVGFLLGWSIPKEYQSEASIIPETPGEGALGGAASLASMAGISLGSSEDAIGPELYPNVVGSASFIVDLLYTPVRTVDGEVETDLYTYLTRHSRMPWWSYGKVALGKVMKSIMPPKRFVSRGADERLDPERLGLEDEALVEGLKYALGCTMSEKTGVVYLSYRCQDPLIAKTIVDTMATRLQTFITDYRTSKARVDLEHYQQMEQETRQQYERAMAAYARYSDSHSGNLLTTTSSERDALENEMEMALLAYQRMKQQVQLSESKVQEQTPAFTVLERAAIPTRHCAPHKMLMAIMWGFLALVGCMAWYYVRLLLGKE